MWQSAKAQSKNIENEDRRREDRQPLAILLEIWFFSHSVPAFTLFPFYRFVTLSPCHFVTFFFIP
jgi:hypothetical protein